MGIPYHRGRGRHLAILFSASACSGHAIALPNSDRLRRQAQDVKTTRDGDYDQWSNRICRQRLSAGAGPR